jgi:tRNA(Arg) A34 adenosine deaminase TadA
MKRRDGQNFDRRHFALAALGSVAALFPAVRPGAARDGTTQVFVAEAERMKREAVAAGDQPFGAVVVMGETIVGYGPSRVVSDRNPDAHAERVALWDAQRRLGRRDLSGAVIYSTSRPCAICEQALAKGGIEQMFFGPEATDADKPGRSG